MAFCNAFPVFLDVSISDVDKEPEVIFPQYFLYVALPAPLRAFFDFLSYLDAAFESAVTRDFWLLISLVVYFFLSFQDL